jgi:hypothetical protein
MPDFLGGFDHDQIITAAPRRLRAEAALLGWRLVYPANVADKAVQFVRDQNQCVLKILDGPLKVGHKTWRNTTVGK